VDQLRARLGGELQRYMSPVTLPTVIASDEESNELDSPLRTGVDAESTEAEREL
jgi:hypothetical protein